MRTGDAAKHPCATVNTWPPAAARPIYFATPLPLVGQGQTEPCAWLYAYEWINPRPATAIIDVQLCPAGQAVGPAGEILDPADGRIGPQAAAPTPVPDLLLVAATALKLREP